MVPTKELDEEFQSKIQEMKDRVADMEREAKGKIERNPFSSVAVAFGVGAAAGAIATALWKHK